MASALLIAGILVFASAIQTATGFGLGMVSVPLLLLLGLDMTTVLPLVAGAALGQLLTGVSKLRREIDWRHAVRVALWQVLAMPVGILAMQRWLAGSSTTARQVVGAALLVLITAATRLRPQPRSPLPAIWGAVAGACSGFFGGLVGMGGPPLVVYAIAHDWSKDRFRAFLWAQFLLANPLLVAMLVIQLGSDALLAAGLGLALTPAIWVGMWLGFFVTRQWDRARLDVAAITLLYVLAASSLLLPFWLQSAR